jgi:hypothetical protein
MYNRVEAQLRRSSLTVATDIHQSSMPHALLRSLVYVRSAKTTYAIAARVITVAEISGALSPK